MNDRAQVGEPSTADHEASTQGTEPADVFYRDPRRVIAALAGGALVLSGVARRSAFGLGLAVAGVSLVARAITGKSLESLVSELWSRRQRAQGHDQGEGKAAYGSSP
jgi:uncharacterized membrane protein